MSAGKRAGGFDIRTFIGAAVGIIGVYLLVVAFTWDPELDKTGGVHANLWTGVAMVVVAALFFVWARVSPLSPTAEADDAAAERAEG
jgi:drug/metabolite transporter (DMT)-like permease